MTDLPGHVVESLLREVPGARRVLRTRFAGERCVTRVLLGAQVEPELGPQVHRAALHGRGSLAGVPEEVLLTLEGYVVAARLPQPDPRWPEALDAGVTPEGWVYVTTRWIEGKPLHHLSGLSGVQRRAVALGVLEILCELHAHNVVYGDLKPENVVIGPDGGVAIIDLDTLREVGGPFAFAITRDVTRSWAAPEQMGSRRTYLASDLWGWARLVWQLFPEGPPEGWTRPLVACAQLDPLRRPHTLRLLATLQDPAEPLLDWRDRPTPPEGAVSGDLGPVGLPGAPAGTERVPEAPVATERVPEAPRTRPPSEAPVPTPPAPGRRGRSCLLVGAGLALGLVGLCCGPVFWWDRSNAAEANRLAEEAMAALKAHKVNAELNTAEQRQAVLKLAEKAYATRHTPRSSAVRALALVWAQGWQDSGRKWDPDGFGDAEDALRKVEDSRQPEALLARGTLHAAACRLNRKEATAMADCHRALEVLGDLQDRLPKASEHHWLRVEGAWTEVLVRLDLAARLRDAGSPEADAMLSGAVDRCTEAGPWLPYAPVNGPELLQDCLRADGLAGDLDRYLSDAARLVEMDTQDGELGRATVWHVYAGADPDCESATVEKRRGEWVVSATTWCLAVGHLARGCHASASWAIAQGAFAEPERPWETLTAHLNPGKGDVACAR